MLFSYSLKLRHNFSAHLFNGSGTFSDPYRIYDGNDLGAVWQQPDKHFRLANHIDLQGMEWLTVPVPFFSGSLDGNGHSISHLKIDGNGFLGLFGEIYPGGSITYVDLENIQITGMSYRERIISAASMPSISPRSTISISTRSGRISSAF